MKKKYYIFLVIFTLKTSYNSNYIRVTYLDKTESNNLVKKSMKIKDIASFNLKITKLSEDKSSFKITPKEPLSWQELYQHIKKAVNKSNEEEETLSIVLDTTCDKDSTNNKKYDVPIRNFENGFLQLFQYKNTQAPIYNTYNNTKIKGRVGYEEQAMITLLNNLKKEYKFVFFYEGILQLDLDKFLTINKTMMKSEYLCQLSELIMNGFKFGYAVEVSYNNEKYVFPSKNYISEIIFTQELVTIYNTMYKELYGNEHTPYYQAMKKCSDITYKIVPLEGENIQTTITLLKPTGDISMCFMFPLKMEE